MSSLIKLLLDIKENPCKFLGNASCQKLAGFLAGWKMAIPEFICPPHDPNFRLLSSWMLAKYGLSGSFDAFAIVQMVAGGDYEAFQLFYEELNLFQRENPAYLQEGYSFLGGETFSVGKSLRNN